MMKFISIPTILFLYYSTCIATDDIVKFLYNDGISYNEIEVPLRPTQDSKGRSIRTGSLNIPTTDVYAARILSGPDDVYCIYETEFTYPRGNERGGEQRRLKKIGRTAYKFNTIMHYTSPPQDVIRITCSVKEFSKEQEEDEERRTRDANLFWHRFSRGDTAAISLDEMSLPTNFTGLHK